jgi:hypothetical protein
MIGERLESQGGLPWAALLVLAVGVVLVATGLTPGLHELATGGVLPLALGASFWLMGRERHFTATVREEGLDIETGVEPILVPYMSIRNIKVGGRLADPVGCRKSSSRITVLHDGGLLNIPSRLNFPSHQVYRFLAEQVPRSGGRDVNPVLADYLERQEQYFGPESVATFRAASRRMRGAWLGYRAFWIGVMVSGGIWSALAISGLVDSGWGVAGFLCILFGALLYGISFAEGISSGGAIKNWKKASIVVGPHGMAMIQGDIEGEVRWPELLEIRFNTTGSAFNLTSLTASLPGILLRVKGAHILIADIYDRPLHVIHGRILASSGRSTPLDLE